MPKVDTAEVRRWMVEGFVSMGASQKAADDQADLLMKADFVGHYSHGLNRYEFYIQDIKNGRCDPVANPVILKESPATALVDGCDGFGATVGNFCMDLAIQKAKEVGAAWVSARNCNHYGMAGYWAAKAEKEGLIGMSFTNSSPLMVPTRAKNGALGTNPIGMAAPGLDGHSLLVDMATTSVAFGKIEVQLRKNEPIPAGWALGPDGKVTTDPKVAMKTSKLLPLGGVEETSGYKGYGLSGMVGTFCHGLSGGQPTHEIDLWTLEDTKQKRMGLSQCFAAINPDFFAPGFRERTSEQLNYWRNMEPVDPSLPVLAPGDKERNNCKATEERRYIEYSDNQIETCARLSKKLNIKPLKVL